MSLDDRTDNECEKRFVASFVQKPRQDRYLEMLRKGKREKFLDELCGRMWNHLEPRTTLHCRSGVTLHDIARVCPKMPEVVRCHITDYDQEHDDRIIGTKDLFSAPDALMNSNASIITFLPGELALYCLEGHVALCCTMKGFSGMLASHPMFEDIVDRAWGNK